MYNNYPNFYPRVESVVVWLSLASTEARQDFLTCNVLCDLKYSLLENPNDYLNRSLVQPTHDYLLYIYTQSYNYTYITVVKAIYLL